MAYRYAIALTGGIATGKSTTASLLKLHGFAVIDADAIAHRLLDQNAKTVAKLFGTEFIREGKVDRAMLGRLVFSNEEARKRLEAFLHPLIRQEIEKKSERLDGFKIPYFIEIPLFFETRSYPIAVSVLVYAPKNTQFERLTERKGMDKEEALRRIESQMDIEEKKKLATYIIDNSKDLKNLQSEVERLIKILGHLQAV